MHHQFSDSQRRASFRQRARAIYALATRRMIARRAGSERSSLTSEGSSSACESQQPSDAARSDLRVADASSVLQWGHGPVPLEAVAPGQIPGDSGANGTSAPDIYVASTRDRLRLAVQRRRRSQSEDVDVGALYETPVIL